MDEQSGHHDAQGFDNPAARVDQPASGPDAPPTWRQSMRFTCASCGYGLSGLAVDGLCPECGTPIAYSLNPQTRQSSGSAVASLVLGIVSIVGCMAYGLPSLICGPLAIYFGMVGLRQAREGSASQSSAGLARAGLICGIIGSALALIGIAFFAIALFLPMAAGSGMFP